MAHPTQQGTHGQGTSPAPDAGGLKAADRLIERGHELRATPDELLQAAEIGRELQKQLDGRVMRTVHPFSAPRVLTLAAAYLSIAVDMACEGLVPTKRVK